MVWKDVKGYEGLYQVSNSGLIRSVERFDCKNKRQQEVILKHSNNGKGYSNVVLCKNGKPRTFYIHKIVAEAFIPKIEGKNFINHKDGNKQNNNVNNLEWCTRSENMKHAYKNGLAHVVNKKLSDEDIKYIQSQKGKKSCFELAKEFDVSFQLICRKWKKVKE